MSISLRRACELAKCQVEAPIFCVGTVYGSSLIAQIVMLVLLDQGQENNFRVKLQ